MNNNVLAFDIYGTLIDTNGVRTQLQQFFGQQAAAITAMWRDKQLEYAFRQTAMGLYRGFSFCTRAALDYTLKHYRLEASATQKDTLLQSYQQLPAFADVKPALAVLRQHNRVCAFSNGESELLAELLAFNQLQDCFDNIVSVDQSRHFKPSPQVYAHFNAVSQSRSENTFLISSNPFDIIGAAHFGWRTIWLQRNPHTVFDDWGITPTHTLSTLAALPALLPAPA